MSDQQAIISVIEKYIEAGRLGKSEVMKEVFTDNATMYFVQDGQLTGGPIQMLFDAVDGAGPAPDLTSEFGAIDINGTTATVRLELFNWGGARYTDQHAMVKVNGEWKILHKIYHTH